MIWPWSIDAEGQSYVFETKEAAIEQTRALLARNVHSIDVGCMQVNLLYHPTAFADLDEAFDPQANVRYAALFLDGLYRQTGTWAAAAANYHSATPALGGPYRDKVLAIYPNAIDPAEERRVKLIRAWAATEEAQALDRRSPIHACHVSRTISAVASDPFTALRAGFHTARRTSIGRCQTLADNR